MATYRALSNIVDYRQLYASRIDFVSIRDKILIEYEL